MDLRLTDEQAELLRNRLKNDLAGLKEEIGKTENYDWRMALKKDEETLQSIISMLERTAA